MVSLGPEEKRHLLAQMLDVSPDTIRWQRVDETIQFKSNQHFSSDLQNFIAAQQENYQGTAAALTVKGLMTSAEQDDFLPNLIYS
jgi:hypothetical protein